MIHAEKIQQEKFATFAPVTFKVKHRKQENYDISISSSLTNLSQENDLPLLHTQAFISPIERHTNNLLN